MNNNDILLEVETMVLNPCLRPHRKVIHATVFAKLRSHRRNVIVCSSLFFGRLGSFFLAFLGAALFCYFRYKLRLFRRIQLVDEYSIAENDRTLLFVLLYAIGGALLSLKGHFVFVGGR